MTTSKRKPHDAWCKSGWRASADGGRVIEFTLHLPLTYNIYVFREQPGKPWQFRFGRSDPRPGTFNTPNAAKLAAEDAALVELRASIRELSRPAKQESKSRPSRSGRSG